MIQLEQKILEGVRTLPETKQQEVLDFIESLKTRTPEPESTTQEPEPISALTVAGDLVGCLEGGPADLSTNKKYLEGFGRT
jgi:hypothetical protein